MSIKNFALIGAAGYVAPRHMEAIRSTGNILVAALDKNDSVGILDRYFPNADFFTEFERFDRHLEKLKRQGKTKVDFVSICSPNYLHDAHIRFALRYGADAICEKPLVLNPWNVDVLTEIEKETGRRIFSILQLRHHPTIQALKKKVADDPKDKIYDIELTYITPRGKWYYTSWKGDEAKSGGIATNIGVHFFDMLTWVFGSVKKNEVHLRAHDRASGFLELEKARVTWYLSIDKDTLLHVGKKDLKSFRSILIDGKELEFSSGFEDLHTISYSQILEGKGFSLSDVKPSIEVVHEIREKELVQPERKHSLSDLPAPPHPFTLKKA